MNPQSAFLSLALFGIFDRLDVFNGDAHQFRILRAVESPIGMNAVEIAGVISMILFWLVLLLIAHAVAAVPSLFVVRTSDVFDYSHGFSLSLKLYRVVSQ